MKNNKLFIGLFLAAIVFASCGNSKNEHSVTDSSTMVKDTAQADTLAVAEADSTHSFRNDRGTDSVSAGKTIPAKP